MGIGPAQWSLAAYAAAGVLYFLLASSAAALEIDLERPGEREFVRDLAEMITPEDEQKIRQQCEALLNEKATPFLVVTIESMSRHGGQGLRIETFATLLFDQWGIGHATLEGQDWNTGILLLVSRDDRKARIELGGGWGRREDAQARQIMDQQIIPHFKQGRFSTGIVAGVDALDKMARKLEVPTQPAAGQRAASPPTPWWVYVMWFGLAALALFTGVSLFRRGSSGWAWLMWAAIFGGLGAVLYYVATNLPDNDDRGGFGGGGFSGGSFSGGSFGGGFSGGGGATGSW